MLAPVDGSDNASRAIAFLVKLARTNGPIEVVLVNVQPTPELRALAQVQDALMTELNQMGAELMADARAQLSKASVSFKERLEVGPVAETVVRCAREEGCDQIVMGTRGAGTIAGLLLGSIATKVLHLSNVPVTLVK
ncbi:MAG TPA: universal stress protein [Hyphomicrobiaceae bacterium]|nr:universal stress protein [Hyphomicrobiaceae bacterium]